MSTDPAMNCPLSGWSVFVRVCFIARNGGLAEAGDHVWERYAWIP